MIISKLKIFVNCWRVSVPALHTQYEFFSTTIDCAISLQRYAGFFEFLLLSWRNVKHLVTLSLGLSWHNEIIWLLLLKNNIGCQYSIAKSPTLCSGNKFCTMTQLRCKVHCMVPVMIRSPIYLNYNAFTSIYTQFQLYFLSDYIYYACSFEALKSGFVEVVLVNDVTSHGIRKPKLVLSNSRKLSFPMMYSLPI